MDGVGIEDGLFQWVEEESFVEIVVVLRVVAFGLFGQAKRYGEVGNK